MDEIPVFHSTEIYLRILYLNPYDVHDTHVRAASIRM